MRFRGRVRGSAEDLELHPRDSGAHAERGCSTRGKIDDAALDVRAAIIDSNPHRFAVVETGYPDLGAQRKGSVRRSQSTAVVALSARRAFPVEPVAVHRRQTRLRRLRTASSGRHREGAAGGQPEAHSADRHPVAKVHSRRSHQSHVIARMRSGPQGIHRRPQSYSKCYLAPIPRPTIACHTWAEAALIAHRRRPGDGHGASEVTVPCKSGSGFTAPARAVT